MMVRATSSILLMLSTGPTGAVALASSPAASHVIALSGPFHTRSPWRFTASQGSDMPDPIGMPGGVVPGPVRLCISADGGRTCRPDLGKFLRLSSGPDFFSEPHYLLQARIVLPRADKPFLLLQLASLHGGDGDQRVVTTLLGYDRPRDRFVTVYREQTGRNNNQEVRYIADGPLKGAVASAEPMRATPFGYWIAISRLGPEGRYRQVLRYPSTTRYNDGNPLAVLDSEMPTIERRLGLRRAGSAPPLPRGERQRPRTVREESWC